MVFANIGSMKTNITRHNGTCSMAFGKYSQHNDCPRCNELKAGAPARAGWQKGYFSRKAQQEAAQLRAIEAHFAPGGRYSQLKAAGMEFTDTAFSW